jgi:nitroreductase
MSEQLKNAFSDILDARRSVRGFKSRPASQQVLDSVFEFARRAPSNCNTQPWQVAVASGDSIERLRQSFPEAISQGKFDMDFDYTGQYEGVYKERQHDAAAQLYSAQGIAREDKARRNEVFMENFQFFGAPHVAFLFLPEQFGIREAVDVGMFAQNLMLSLCAHGLASCPQTALSFDASTVRETLGVDSANKLLFGISFGFEDHDHPANKCRVGRAELPQNITFNN